MNKLLAVLAFGCAVMGTEAETATAKPGLRFVDATSAFDATAAAANRLKSDKAKVALFEKRMALVADGFYARSRNPKKYDERVLGNLKAYPEQRAKIRAISREFQKLFGPARDSFQRAFGLVSSSQPVYLVHSLGEMDGGTRDNLNNKNSTLVFGADVIARIHYGKDMTPFFHHELFHVYHEPVMKKCDAIWCSLWEEGLATYVAKQLTPSAGDAALSLDQPAPIRPAVDANLAGAICATKPLLSSENGDDYGKLFFGNAHVDGFPARMGYYLGYLVVAKAGKTRTLKELAALKPAEIKPLVDSTLNQMAICPTRASRS